MNEILCSHSAHHRCSSFYCHNSLTGLMNEAAQFLSTTQLSRSRREKLVELIDVVQKYISMETRKISSIRMTGLVTVLVENKWQKCLTTRVMSNDDNARKQEKSHKFSAFLFPHEQAPCFFQPRLALVFVVHCFYAHRINKGKNIFSSLLHQVDSSVSKSVSNMQQENFTACIFNEFNWITKFLVWLQSLNNFH